MLGGTALSGGRATFPGLSTEHGLMIIGVLLLIGIVLFQMGDLKELVKPNYKRARRLVVGSRVQGAAALPDFFPAGPPARVVPAARTLIRGGRLMPSTTLGPPTPDP